MKCPNCGFVIQNLSQAVREAADEGMTPAEIKELLGAAGYFDHYTSDPLISIYTILQRKRRAEL